MHHTASTRHPRPKVPRVASTVSTVHMQGMHAARCCVPGEIMAEFAVMAR